MVLNLICIWLVFAVSVQASYKNQRQDMSAAPET